MKFADITCHDMTTLIAVGGMVLGLLMAICFDQKDLGYVIAGALGGAISLKERINNYDKG
ncbi:MAG: hypothetical protein MR853_07220 [Selenomonadales bacterium]|nr:hypothetical protein [Selenomonadales bacterium]